jgi:hypothetical protein
MKHLIRMISLAIVLCMVFTFSASAETASPVYSASDLFTSRDYEQTADLSGAVTCAFSDGQDIHIAAAGVYVLTGKASNVTVYVEAGKEDKVQLVLDGVTVVNADFPVIYVKTADKVFVTVSGDSALSVTGSFRADGDTKTDGVIFSKTDLTLNGTASLIVSSADNGIVCKDDLKITGGTYEITAANKCVDANDSVRIADGTFILDAGADGIHAENGDNDTLGYIYIGGGAFTVRAGDDGICATSVLQIDGGALDVSAVDGLKATYIRISGGTVEISASDEGVHAAARSEAYDPAVDVTGGTVTVNGLPYSAADSE